MKHGKDLWGWSELVATNAQVEDEPIQPVLRMNILLARRDFFFHLLSASKFSTSPLLPTPSYLPPTKSTPPSYLHPPTYHLPTPPPFTPSPKLQRPRVVVERELELWLWSGSWSGWSWSRTQRPQKGKMLAFFFFVCFV